RIVSFGPKAQEVVRPFLLADPLAFVFRPADGARSHSESRRTGRAGPQTTEGCSARRFAPSYSRHGVRLAVARGCIKAKVPWWHPHQLRHAAATRIRQEFGLDAARAVLGHAGARITELYAAADTGKAQEVMARVG